MNVLIVGNGAREHALAWKFSTSKRITGLFVGPGNAGTEGFAINLSEVQLDKPATVLEACKKNAIDLVFVGPEVPLSMGLVDLLVEAGIRTVGPKKYAAQLESSKAFSKNFMVKHKIPTAAAKTVSTESELEKLVTKAVKSGSKLVLKFDGLAAGKGVLESDDRNQLLSFGKEWIGKGPVLVEEYLSGFEISVFALTDGKSYKMLPPCTDYKKAGDDNKGPNTGGMGAICPIPWVDAALLQEIEKKIVIPTFEGFRKEKFDYRGVVYFGLMITAQGPKLLEYNARFGDPEAQVLIPLIESDFCNLSEAICDQTLGDFNLDIVDKTAVCVVVASPGYPGAYRKDLPVSLPKTTRDQFIFHASTYSSNGNLYTNGGRCFSAVHLGPELLQTRALVYPLASGITFPGAWYRKDIGNRIFGTGEA